MNLWRSNVGEESQLMFNHLGNYGPIVDFDWNKDDPWSIFATTDDTEALDVTDGCLSLFRPNSIILPSNEETSDSNEKYGSQEAGQADVDMIDSGNRVN